jgi:glycerophosphoryl diester phosphodiesterase
MRLARYDKILSNACLLGVVLAMGGCGRSMDSGAGTEPEFTQQTPMLLIAHRGASGLAPEHTLASFELAADIGVDYLEQDLQQTRDGVLVVLHDETLDRTARGPKLDCTGLVRDKTLAQLERCDFGAWFGEAHPAIGHRFDGQRILTLAALIDRFGSSVRYYIETKHPEEAEGLEASLISILEERGLLDAENASRLMFQSFSKESLVALAEKAPEIPRLQLLDRGQLRPPYDAELSAVAKYANGIGPHYSDVDVELVAAAHRHGLKIHVYTVNDPGEMRRLEALDVDGIFTDFPDRYRALAGRSLGVDLDSSKDQGAINSHMSSGRPKSQAQSSPGLVETSMNTSSGNGISIPSSKSGSSSTASHENASV